MFSAVRRRLTYANVALTVALVFAMSGGAYAASKYLITSTKQIKPSVLASLKGKAGVPGANGVQGPAGVGGTQGPAGPAGPAGPKGETGPVGSIGKEGAKGATGPAGPAGQTGFTSTLPAGKTETGTWSATAFGITEPPNPTFAISFPIPLAAGALQINRTFLFSEEQTEEKEFEVEGKSSGCEGIVNSVPTAPPGTLCVYTNGEISPTTARLTFQGFGQTGSAGTLLFYRPSEKNGFSKENPGTIRSYGTWAVTSPAGS